MLVRGFPDVYTCHNWGARNVVVQELSEVGEVGREAGADLNLVVAVVDHVTDPPGAGEGLTVHTLSPRHLYSWIEHYVRC